VLGLVVGKGFVGWWVRWGELRDMMGWGREEGVPKMEERNLRRVGERVSAALRREGWRANLGGSG
jgi:hypothetical protein